MKHNLFQPVSLLCTQWGKKLASRHVDDLSADEKKALREHLASCLACTRLHVEYKTMDDAINHLPPVRPLVGFPEELAAQMKKRQREESMSTNEISKEADPAIPTAFIQKRKIQKGVREERFLDRKSRRWAQTMSSFASVLVVCLIVSVALVVFSYRAGSSRTTIGSGSTGASLTAAPSVLYTNVETQKANIYAVDPHNGSIFWKVTLPTKLTTMDLTPHQGLLFAPGYDGNLYALNATNGAIVWKYPVKNDPNKTAAADRTFPASPIINGNFVYFSTENGLYAIDIHTGRQLWYVKKDCKPPQTKQQGNMTYILSTQFCASLGAVANGRVYTALDDGLHVLDAQTGNELWHDPRFQFVGPQNIAVVDDNVYVSPLESNGLFILNASDGKEKTHVMGALHHGFGSTMAVDGIVYYSDGQKLVALDGTRILWTQNYQLMELLAGSNGTLFALSMSPLQGSAQVRGEQGAYFYALDANTGAIRWHWGEKGGSWGPGYPLSFDGKLYFFYGLQQGNTWINALWVLHDNQRDIFPLKEPTLK
jgi:outer membrane protein assembly factor BamB